MFFAIPALLASVAMEPEHKIAAVVLGLACPLLVAWGAWRVHRADRDLARRLRSGLCTHCGYDRRASPERCPECGKVSEDSKGVGVLR